MSVAPTVRIQHNLLALNERRLLNWLAARTPRWVVPDALTALGLTGAAMVGAGYALSAFDSAWLWLSIAGFFVNWYGDSLDGSLARFRKIERPLFGYFIDHSSDALGNLFIMVGIGASPFVRMDVALLGLAAYLLLSIHTFLAARVIGEFRLSYLSGGPTELRLVLIGMSLAMLVTAPVGPILGPLSGFDLFIGALGIVLFVLFVVQTLATAKQLLHRDAQERESA
ncbi:MAG: CDP-alcohol phosphatidyltransferase family protein [Sphingomonadales bacterium]|nr:CDP-alcohol phosphatidyltransferase family protein [Sphingomonadales bacterium]